MPTSLKLTYWKTFAVTLTILGSLNTPASAQQSPKAMLQEKIDLGLTIIKDPSLQGIDKTTERREKLWQEAKPIFDFDEISRRALGQNGNTITPEQRAKFTELFTTILRNVYLGKSDNYSGERIDYLNEIIQGKRSRVETIFVSKSGESYEVNFSLHNLNGSWKVYDIVIEGVSIISNYRSQFNDILTKSSFDDLIQKLEEKVKTLDESESL